MSGEDAILHITVRLGGQNGKDSMTEFKIKRTTKMGKVFKAYAKVKGKSLEHLKFLLDGERVMPDQTPKMLEMEDGDQIDAFIEQVGGAPARH
jgi:small ubiquitin-related modifier